MDLSQFVKVTLTQIIEGVTKAMEQTKEHSPRVVINPTLGHAAHAEATKIQFDVAVTVQESGEAKGESSVQVFGMKFGVDGSKTNANIAVSRITFEIPVALPSVAKDQYPSYNREADTYR